MKIKTFLSVNNEKLGAISRMSNGTYICIVYKGVQVVPKQGFQKYVWVTTVLRSTLEIFCKYWCNIIALPLNVLVLVYICKFSSFQIVHQNSMFLRGES